MNTHNNTILVTGGGSGIGLEIARLFSERGNTIIITGRNEQKLKQAVAQLKNTSYIVSDVSKEADVNKLVATLEKDHPALNILINNAGTASVHNLAEGTDAFNKASDEILTNYLAPIRLNEKLLPLLKKQSSAAIVTVSSIAAIVPNKVIPTYSASKAALHSYSQALRISLEKDTAVKVFELMPPLVNTDFSQEIGGINGIPPSVVATDLLTAMEQDVYEIHSGLTADFYKLFLSSPAEALHRLNNR
ncbi:MAG: SDR family NAD(P)-dependent oxidoreductase [Chitinophagaceae bacterium]